MDKVSGTLLAKFNCFIAGDEDDVKSYHSGTGNDVGPFAKIAGNSPSPSPSQSNADLYGAYAYGGTAPASGPPANSRYAPSNAHALRSSLDQGRSRYEPQGRPSMESTDGSLGIRPGSDSYVPSPSLSGPYTPSQYSPPSQRTQSQKAASYSPPKPDAVAAPLSYGSPY